MTELEELRTQNAALHQKLETLTKGQTCGCSFDKDSEVCMYHAPAVVIAYEKVGELEAELDSAFKLIERQGEHIRQCVELMRGPPPENCRWSHHDVVDLLKHVMLEHAMMKSLVNMAAVPPFEPDMVLRLHVAAKDTKHVIEKGQEIRSKWHV